VYATLSMLPKADSAMMIAVARDALLGPFLPLFFE
jgi:hypothetical protein